MIKVIHISASDKGGAGRATYRIHKSLLNTGIKSEIWVNRKKTNDPKVFCPKGKLHKALAYLKPYTRIPFLKLLITKNPILHSPAIFSSSWIKKINQSDADVVNLHWVQHEMLSISDIGKITKPIVWTLHDMWAFCGAEHISWDNRWKKGYYKANRPTHEKWFDLNRWTWNRKVKHWKKPIQIITPSSWLSKYVKESKLMSNWPTRIIANPIDTKFWKPENKIHSRKLFKFTDTDLILLFGTSNSNFVHHKGFDLLKRSLKFLKKKKNIKLVIFGQDNCKFLPELEIPVMNIGFLKNDKILKSLYCAADLMIVPSRQDNLPNNAIEAQSCGTPVVSFNIGGLVDIIEHQKTGYLAQAFDIKDLANGITWVLEHAASKKLGNNARQRSIKKFAEKKIAADYLSIYKKNLQMNLKKYF